MGSQSDSTRVDPHKGVFGRRDHAGFSPPNAVVKAADARKSDNFATKLFPISELGHFVSPLTLCHRVP